MHFQEEKMENLKFYVDQNAPKTNLITIGRNA